MLIVEHYITFRAGRQEFAMNATRLRGLMPLNEMMPLKTPRESIVGVASIRGHNFPVVDLRCKMGLAASAHGRRPCVVAVEVRGARLLGFVADRVSEVIPLRELALRSGQARVGGRWRRLLDPDQILSEEELENFSRFALSDL